MAARGRITSRHATGARCGSEQPFDMGMLADLRGEVARFAAAHGRDRERSADFVLAVHEVATNSVQHGGGEGVLRLWHDGRRIVGEVRDRGHIPEPLVGRLRPGVQSFRGRGLWMANQLCDLVQVRSTSTGTVVRLHMRDG